jgi:hypothetical protein
MAVQVLTTGKQTLDRVNSNGGYQGRQTKPPGLYVIW